MQNTKINSTENFLGKIKSQGTVIIELGAGLTRRVPNALTMDMLDSEAVDIVHNINNGLAFIPDASVNEYHSTHVFEHIENFEQLMFEMYRTLKPGGRIIGTVPHFANPYFYSDYTHSKYFGLYTFSYFSKKRYFKRQVPNFYTSLNFEIVKMELEFDSPFWVTKVFKKFWQLIFNSCKIMREIHEQSFCYALPAYQLRFEVKKAE
jgi:predicted SAM-dependent methyltransferase